MIKENPVGKLRSNCWAFFEKTLNEWLRYYFGTNCERNLGVSFKMCLMGMLMGSFRTYSQLAHWSSWDQSGGLFLKKIKTCLLGMWWVNCLKDHKKLSICPLGFTPFAPSVMTLFRGWYVGSSFSLLCYDFISRALRLSIRFPFSFIHVAVIV